MEQLIALDGAIRSCGFSADGDFLAIGMKNGEFHVLKAANLQLLSKKRDRNKAVSDIK